MGGVIVDPTYGMTTVDLSNTGYRDEPFVLAKDVTQVFYVMDMSSKQKKGISKKRERAENNNPKRHIVLPEKRKIMGVEDVTDEEDYNQFDDIPPFTVQCDTSILLANEEAPYMRRDHDEGTLVKRQFVTIPL